ncbi:hypothetical protein L1D19_23195 [Vibrio natriegens]|uniref:hypothetical protein n=1 Tax=Vibrio natriegens TaxID=691 RepID=UPI001EFD23B6|nr:hypothetical protein [Vibrio natriegens]MCG9702976.1 hypothetical protein [Vibrio natriegens]
MKQNQRSNPLKDISVIILLLLLLGCTPEDDKGDTYVHETYCGVMKNGSEYTVNHHPYSLVNNGSGHDIDDNHCITHMFKTYQYDVNTILTLNTEIRKGEINELHHYINLAVKYGYHVNDGSGFSLLGEATTDFSNQDDFGWSSVENNLILETNIGEQELYQSVTFNEQGTLMFHYHSSDGQQGEAQISVEEALLFFYGGERALEAMENIEYFSSLF